MYETEGRIYHQGKKFFAYYTENNAFDNTPDRYRIILIEKGTLIAKINGEKTTIISPCLILLNEKDKIEIIEQDNTSSFTLYFLPKILNKELTLENLNDPLSREKFSDTVKQDYEFFSIFLKNDINNKIFNFLPWETFKKIKSLMQNINEEMQVQKDSWWTCSSRCYLIQILFIIYRISKQKTGLKTEKTDHTDRLIDKILVFLNANYDKKITLSELARKFNTNRTTLNKIFKKEMNKTIIRYLIELRINMASSMLHSSALSVNEIMYRVGFNDSANFIRIFKKINKYTPKQYKDKYSWLTAKKIV